MTGSLALRHGRTVLVLLAVLLGSLILTGRVRAETVERFDRMAEWSFQSPKHYADPFNEVEIDFLFSRDGKSWRVPAFWRGGDRWTIRFAPPQPGLYRYRVESNDPANRGLARLSGSVRIDPYRGDNPLYRHGAITVAADKRHFAHQDGTPFFWLADTLWTGLSDRIDWAGFQAVVRDRRAKGFTAVQIVAGLVPGEEQIPSDPGAGNEGGQVWEPHFTRINPAYFDYADRRIQLLLDNQMAPVIVGGWHNALSEMGEAKLKQHWRYLVARYGAYPVFWVTGGEVIDPPDTLPGGIPGEIRGDMEAPGGWTAVARYIRSVDPYHHPLTFHEPTAIKALPYRDPAVSDYRMFQSGHDGWASIARQITQLNLNYARTDRVQPLVVGEIGYEKLFESHLEDFQRAAFWMSMLNGAAGHTYGANGLWEAYGGDRPLHRKRWSFLSWQEGMALPGSRQVGIGAELLRAYPWSKFTPRPDWVTPGGTTLLEPREQLKGDELGFREMVSAARSDPMWSPYGFVGGVWRARDGDYRAAYAAGVPSQVRFIYMPFFGEVRTPPTILGLEAGVRYRAFFWEPSTGTRMDLGNVERAAPGRLLRADTFASSGSAWRQRGADKARVEAGALRLAAGAASLLDMPPLAEGVVGVSALATSNANILVRYIDEDNYLAAAYDAGKRRLDLVERRAGTDHSLATTAVPVFDGWIRLHVEVRGGHAIAMIEGGAVRRTTLIADVSLNRAGGIGLAAGSGAQSFDDFELREGSAIPADADLDRRLIDAEGRLRGVMEGAHGIGGSFTSSSWDSFGRDKILLLDAYRPQKMPTPGDWLLILDATDTWRRLNGSRERTGL